MPLLQRTAASFAVALLPLVAAAQPYRTAGVCGGLPRVPLATAPGHCVGLVAAGLKFPRGVLPLADGRVLVAEMGSWEPRRGAVVALVPQDKGYRRVVLVDRLDRPNGLALGPDGKVYVGEVGRIVRFSPREPKPVTEPVAGEGSAGRRFADDGRHPLITMVFGADRDLYVNIGSASDNCEPAGTHPGVKDGRCPESEGESARGVIRRYRMRWPEGAVAGTEIHARGLRNSMALAVHPRTGVLWQADNARDDLRAHLPGLKSDEDEPHDELNAIEGGAHYGWPYCYDAGKRAPEFPRADCARYRDPAVLLPGHAAPLGMTFVERGDGTSLVIGFHGYRANGHRVMTYPFDAKGRPAGSPTALVSGWSAGPGRPLGAPVDVKADAKGRIYVTEDRNGTVLRIDRAD